VSPTKARGDSNPGKGSTKGRRTKKGLQDRRSKRRHRVHDGRFGKDGALAKSKLNPALAPAFARERPVVIVEHPDYLPPREVVSSPC